MTQPIPPGTPDLPDAACSFDPRSHRADCHHGDDLLFQIRAGMAAQVARDLLAEFGPEECAR